uniref:Src homology 2 domain containing F n=1 Tax=Anser brachyrhynchus TaxID=132585 RepID=A0A8B9I6U8_9AVES
SPVQGGPLRCLPCPRGGSSPVPGPRCWCSLPWLRWRSWAPACFTPSPRTCGVKAHPSPFPLGLGVPGASLASPSRAGGEVWYLKGIQLVPTPPPPLNFCFPPLFQLAVLEDYADPFDAAQVAGSQAGLEKVTENDGYMEPYEAQKMMAEIRQKGLREAPSRPLHLYDTPYEPVTGGLEADSDRPACPRPRESRLPEDDERPPEEYDQPWEWKKERISKAFAVEIKVIKDLPWPPPVGQLDSGETPPDGEAGAPGPPQHGQQNYEDANGGSCMTVGEEKARAGLRHGTSSLKSTKTLSAEPGPFLGERIDPALPLESQCWYHGAISRTDAETLLRLCKEASYLVRNSETSKNDFSLSLKSSQGFMHMKLSRTQENKYVLGQHSPPFDSVPEIIHHYASRKLPIKGAEHMSLLYPVAIRTL